MLPRWNSIIYGLNTFLQALDELLPSFKRSKRGRRPKHSIRDYAKLVIAKEAKKSSLREAEQDYSAAVNCYIGSCSCCDRKYSRGKIKIPLLSN